MSGVSMARAARACRPRGVGGARRWRPACSAGREGVVDLSSPSAAATSRARSSRVRSSGPPIVKSRRASPVRGDLIDDGSDIDHGDELDRVLPTAEHQWPPRSAGGLAEKLNPQLEKGCRLARSSPAPCSRSGRSRPRTSCGTARRDCRRWRPRPDSRTTSAPDAAAASIRLMLPSRSTEAGVPPPGPAKPWTAEITTSTSRGGRRGDGRVPHVAEHTSTCRRPRWAARAGSRVSTATSTSRAAKR